MEPRRARTRLAVGCCAMGVGDRARRRTAGSCADGARYVRDKTRPIQITVAAPEPICSRSPTASRVDVSRSPLKELPLRTARWPRRRLTLGGLPRLDHDGRAAICALLCNQLCLRDHTELCFVVSEDLLYATEPSLMSGALGEGGIDPGAERRGTP